MSGISVESGLDWIIPVISYRETLKVPAQSGLTKRSEAHNILVKAARMIEAEHFNLKYSVQNFKGRFIQSKEIYFNFK